MVMREEQREERWGGGMLERKRDRGKREGDKEKKRGESMEAKEGQTGIRTDRQTQR